MSSAEEIIQRHRQRLEEHRKYLERGHSPRKGGAPPSARGQAQETGAADYAEVGTSRDAPGESRRSQVSARVAPSSARAATGGDSPNRQSRDDGRHVWGEGPKYYTDDPTRVFERNNRWLQHKHHSIEKQRLEKSSDATAGCTFKPNTNRSGSFRSVERSSQAYSETADDATKNHVLRQRQARAEKEQVRLLLQPDLSNWEPKQTVPKEFQFGTRSNAISSLRKPVAYVPGKLEKPINNSQSADISPAPQDGNSNGQPQRQSSNRRAVTPNSVGSRAGGRAGGEGGTHGSSFEAVRQMQNTISTQELEIARLNGLVSSLKRELEVAKAKVRQLALAQQTVSQLG